MFHLAKLFILNIMTTLTKPLILDKLKPLFHQRGTRSVPGCSACFELFEA